MTEDIKQVQETINKNGKVKTTTRLDDETVTITQNNPEWGINRISLTKTEYRNITQFLEYHLESKGTSKTELSQDERDVIHLALFQYYRDDSWESTSDEYKLQAMKLMNKFN